MRKYLILTVGLLCLVTACNSGTPASTTPPATSTAASAPTLDGTNWIVSHINGTATVEDHEPTIKFADGKASGSATCNRFFGGYTQDDAALSFDQTAVTQMMCTDDVWMAQEAAFLTALASVTTVRASDTVVELLDADRQIALTLYPVKDQPLEGTTWQLSGILTKDALSSPVGNGSVTLTIKDGKLSGKACNSFSGSVEAGDGTFKAGPLKSTKTACKSKELTKQETTVLKALEAATAFAIDGSELTISAPDGTGLLFIAA